MDIVRIEGCTRVIGEGQGYIGLPLRDVLINCSVNGPETPAMVTAWKPTEEDLVRLNAGEHFHLRILGTQHPPVMVEVAPPPTDPTEG